MSILEQIDRLGPCPYTEGAHENGCPKSEAYPISICDLKRLARDFRELKEAAEKVVKHVGDIEGMDEDKFFAAANELELILERIDGHNQAN